MSTEGAITFIAGGERKNVYNNCDSYPSSLGVEVLTWLRCARDGGLAGAIGRLRIVNDFDGTKPTDQDRERFRGFFQNVGGPDEHWYSLLRDLQGDPAGVLHVGIAYGENDPWGYIYEVNADARELRVLSGSDVLGKWSFDSLPDDNAMKAL